jgi:hypothetical protein
VLQSGRATALHATCWGGNLPDGTVVGAYVWHFSDGTTHEQPIVYGRDLRDWWFGGQYWFYQGDPKSQAEHGQVAWTGSNPVAQRSGVTVRLYLTTYENPHPDLEVTSIDLVSEMTTAAPFLIAMTVGPGND